VWAGAGNVAVAFSLIWMDLVPSDTLQAKSSEVYLFINSRNTLPGLFVFP
jgi:hypothetical protein